MKIDAHKQLARDLAIDNDEYESALRTARAHVRAKELGIKLPYRLAKKFYCRCGEMFVYPVKFLTHRVTCAVLIRDQDLLARKPKVEIVAPTEVKVRKKETYPCRCGHEFPSKRMCSNHQKLCSALKECEDLIVRGKDYLARNKEEPKRKTRGKAKKTSKRKTS